MTMRTRRYFVCSNGHHGVETTSENDQPYSASWESISTEGLKANGRDSRGYATYICEICAAPMTVADAPSK